MSFHVCPDCNVPSTCRTFRACYHKAKAELRQKKRRKCSRATASNGPYNPLDRQAEIARDIEYASVCLERGGFPVAVHSYGRTWWKNASGGVWMLGRPS